MENPGYPLLYQINTRVWLTELAEKLGRTATLDDIPEAELDLIQQMGFQWVWLLSVWQTGPVGKAISRANQEWRKDFEQTLPNLTEDDIAGSGFAITDYSVHRDMGGDEALARLRERLRRRNLRLMLDFVCNHTAPDHRWTESNPEYFVPGTETDLINSPQNYCRVGQNSPVLAHGRDPYFPGWPDTLQLNYGNPATQEAMMSELIKISRQCDGVRCDMAMLILPDVFERTWGIRSQPFWSRAIPSVREEFPEFLFMAEVYWDLEWRLQQEGFDYAYDKRLYDRLREGSAGSVREHLSAPLDYQRKMSRFLENHDEPRAAATFSPDIHRAAAVITFLTPGLRFFHQGEFEGRRKRISPHLVRAPEEPIDDSLRCFYERLFDVLHKAAVRNGQWQMLECKPAWDGNWTSECILCFSWEETGGERLLAAVNFASNDSQCYVELPFPDLSGEVWSLNDLLGTDVYKRDGTSLQTQGLYLDMSPWQAQVFSVSKVEQASGDTMGQGRGFVNQPQG